ncbi:hypothetical protein HDU67_004438 [Dinochytrium kinnereticum]|nr:hypothetical protein HDU67_004438 [Dinochytrium kinnereticum]
MWALYRTQNERYHRNLENPDRQWVHPNDEHVASQATRSQERGYVGKGSEERRRGSVVSVVSPGRDGGRRLSVGEAVGRGGEKRSSGRGAWGGKEAVDEETSGIRTPLSTEGSACDSAASSGIPHSETYEAVRDLNTELWKCLLTPIPKLPIFRNTLESHRNPPEDIENEIIDHAHANNIRFPHSRANNMGLFDLYRKNLSLEGMDPFLHPDEQLARLKEKEKILMVKRWQETWETVRPPVPKWHELRTKSFHKEAAKARAMSASPDLQRISHQARLAILDLWRSQVTDKILFMESMIPEGVKQEMLIGHGDLEDLREIRRSALMSALKNTFHARRPEPGQSHRPEHAFAPWGGAAAGEVLGV